MTGNQPAELQQQYVRRFAAQRDYRYRVWTVLTRDFFQRWGHGQAAVLDLGCGWGEFINQIRAGKRYGMDLNSESPQHLREDVVFFSQDCSTRWPLGDGELDVVFTSNFFEHLPDKAALKKTLEEAYRCLKPGGRLICMGPNIQCVPGAYWDFWDHFIPLTHVSLKEGVELVGFSVERAVGRFLPYTMSTGFTTPIWVVATYLRMPWLWRWFGKQFLVVAWKP